ncbi:MAG TPA: RNA methyltransferase [Arthrobacter sp.]|nr:RNA methyltransferase [Arthrobacter sp.]
MRDAGRPQAMSNPRADRVRNVAKLAGRPARLKRGQFLAEGPQAVREALAAHRLRAAPSGRPVVDELYITAACLERFPEFDEETADTNFRLVTEEVIAAMADTVHSQGVVAVCSAIDVDLAAMLSTRPQLVAVFCRMRDPGNAGTVLRAADAAGADAVVLTSSSVDIYNPKAVRATAGSIFHLPIVLGQDYQHLTAQLRDYGISLLAADGQGDQDLDALQDQSVRRHLVEGGALTADNGEQAGMNVTSAPALEAPTAWIFGNEAQGLNAVELSSADYRVAVPIYGGAESLNLATAATLCLYASARSQRRHA